jgi:REP element-mobilizing transposase RayT
MSHSFTKIWIHSIFSTKERAQIISDKLEPVLHKHIAESLEKDFGCDVKAINGMREHIHILFRLNPNHSLSELMKNIKGESSHWVNSQNFINIKFAWQTGYSTFSISESVIDNVIKYIINQKEHHKKVTFKEEYELFMKKYGNDIINR